MNQNQNLGPGRPTLGEEPADHQIQLRVTKARKLAYMKAAGPGKLTAWCLQYLDRAAGYKPPES